MKFKKSQIIILAITLYTIAGLSFLSTLYNLDAGGRGGWTILNYFSWEYIPLIVCVFLVGIATFLINGLEP